MSGVLQLRIAAPADLTDADCRPARGRPGGQQPRGPAAARHDVRLVTSVLADVAREGVNAIVDRLREMGVHTRGTVHVDPVHAWVSQAGFDAERIASEEQRRRGRLAPSGPTRLRGLRTQLDLPQLYGRWRPCWLQSPSSWDSDILVIGAMVLGPEFGAIAALGVALVRRRPCAVPLRVPLRWSGGSRWRSRRPPWPCLVWRSVRWINPPKTSPVPRPDTARPPRRTSWSFLVAPIAAAAAGVLSLTSAKVGGLSGVFISVCTVPAAGNIGLGSGLRRCDESVGSALQLVINISGMVLAGVGDARLPAVGLEPPVSQAGCRPGGPPHPDAERPRAGRMRARD